MGTDVETQLQTLAQCGIRLVPDVTLDRMLKVFDRAHYEREPYVLLLCALGSELEVEPYRFASDDIWHFDTECIEDHKDYVRIAERLRDLAGGDLPLDEITDYVDIEEGEAWLSFRLDGQRVRWEAEVEGDWVDETILSRFAELLHK